MQTPKYSVFFLCLKIKKSTITGRLHPVIEEMFNEGKLINRDISDIWEAITECVIYYSTIIRYTQYVIIHWHKDDTLCYSQL